jgi:hypothetical protein
VKRLESVRPPASRTVTPAKHFHEATTAASDATGDAHARRLTCRVTGDDVRGESVAANDASHIDKRVVSRGRIAIEGGGEQTGRAHTNPFDRQLAN